LHASRSRKDVHSTHQMSSIDVCMHVVLPELIVMQLIRTWTRIVCHCRRTSRHQTLCSRSLCLASRRSSSHLTASPHPSSVCWMARLVMCMCTAVQFVQEIAIPDGVQMGIWSGRNICVGFKKEYAMVEVCCILVLRLNADTHRRSLARSQSSSRQGSLARQAASGCQAMKFS
jgi:hypothetical protein